MGRYLIIFLSIVLFAGIACAEELVIAKGRTVKIDYELRIDGQLIENTEGKQPLEYVEGEGKVLPGLSAALVGMKVGESKTVIIEPEGAYGEINREAFREVPKSAFPKNFNFVRGQIVEFQNPDGLKAPAIIWEIKDEAVVVNFNHPLAGKMLEFKVKVADIKD